MRVRSREPAIWLISRALRVIGREEIRSTPVINFVPLVQATLRMRTCDEVSLQSKSTNDAFESSLPLKGQEEARKPAQRCCVDSASAQELSSTMRKTNGAGA